jgi:hypothetical protein
MTEGCRALTSNSICEKCYKVLRAQWEARQEGYDQLYGGEPTRDIPIGLARS